MRNKLARRLSFSLLLLALGLLGGDVAGFPNGRRIFDDVVDIALRAVAGGTPFTPATNISPTTRLAMASQTTTCRF